MSLNLKTGLAAESGHTRNENGRAAWVGGDTVVIVIRVVPAAGVVGVTTCDGLNLMWLEEIEFHD